MFYTFICLNSIINALKRVKRHVIILNEQFYIIFKGMENKNVNNITLYSVCFVVRLK